jgi:hypothetical protein
MDTSRAGLLSFALANDNARGNFALADDGPAA